jgi:hypothetical protein
MTYKRNFVVAIKVGGKILRENGDEVQLPFGSEYSVLLKNTNSVRAMAQISIDGVIAGPWYILGPNSSVEIERFNNTGNSERGNKFKFIERTEAIENHRGVRVDDGLVRIEFKKEKVWEPPKTVEHHTYHHHEYYHAPYYPWRYVPTPRWPTNPHITWGNISAQAQNFSGSLMKSTGAPTRSLGSVSGRVSMPSNSGRLMAMNMITTSLPNEAGITVPGSESSQVFTSVGGFETEPQTEVLTLKLMGHSGEVVVEKPVTVDIHAVCQSCGKRAKGDAKFCSRCGTSLILV